MAFNWNEAKNAQLKEVRGISFEEIVASIAGGGLVTVIEHPHPSRFPNQMLYLVEHDDYIYVVPAISDDRSDNVFLKTVYPSRKYTQRYLRRA